MKLILTDFHFEHKDVRGTELWESVPFVLSLLKLEFDGDFFLQTL